MQPYVHETLYIIKLISHQWEKDQSFISIWRKRKLLNTAYRGIIQKYLISGTAPPPTKQKKFQTIH